MSTMIYDIIYNLLVIYNINKLIYYSIKKCLNYFILNVANKKIYEECY